MKELVYNESYFAQCSDEQLYWWCVMFLNGADLSSSEAYEEYQMFMKEVKTRGQYLQDKIDYLHQVI